MSRNTTKTHSVSIYRKLGVATRSEAVDMARQMGILAEFHVPSDTSSDLEHLGDRPSRPPRDPDSR